jgi:hypothetical protein
MYSKYKNKKFHNISCFQRIEVFDSGAPTYDMNVLRLCLHEKLADSIFISTLKVKAKYSTETLAPIYQTTRCHISEDNL